MLELHTSRIPHRFKCGVLTALVMIAAIVGSPVKLSAEGIINEIHYHPRGTGNSLEFIELHNQMSVDMDMGGWQLAGGIEFEFPQGTVIDAGGYLVVASDPAALQAASGFAEALGPFIGFLANNGEEILLQDYTLDRTVAG